MQLRAALRADRERGERIIGWGGGRLGLDRSAELFLVGVMHIPAVGPLLGATMLARQARFFVLTDRRILILPVERAALRTAARRVTLPLGEVSIRGGGTNWAGATKPIRAEHLGRPTVLLIPRRKKSRSTSRLLEGLRVLAVDDESQPIIKPAG